jgi:putative two-component system response regulator
MKRAIADVYDALRTPRCYKPAYDHEGDDRTKPAHFNPKILPVFAEVAGEFASIYERLSW